MKHYRIEFTEENLPKILAQIDRALTLQTNNYEYAMNNEIAKREAYYDARNDYLREYHKTLLEILAKKEVAQTMSEKVAKARVSEHELKMNIAEGEYKSAISKSMVELEKMNSIKKLVDGRGKIGG